MPNVRSIDPTRCWVSHITRAGEPEEGRRVVGRAYFRREPSPTKFSVDQRPADGLNDGEGWATAETTAVLSDNGSFVLTLPNTVGADGILHRRRFAILTDPNYEPGEEWLEFWTDATAHPWVGTPTDYEKTASTITIKGVDMTVVLAGALSSEVDVWDGTAPHDVFGHYSARVPMLVMGEDLGIELESKSATWGESYTRAASAVPIAMPVDCWTCEARVRWIAAKPTVDGGWTGGAGASFVRLEFAGLTIEINLWEGVTALIGAPETFVVGTRLGLVVPGPVTLKLVARYDHVFAFVNGEPVCEFRRPTPFPKPESVKVAVYGAKTAALETQAILDGLYIESLAPFGALTATSPIEVKLPGIPPATGLRTQIWSAAYATGSLTTAPGRVSRMFQLLRNNEPTRDRVDPQVDIAVGATPVDPGTTGDWAARWTGAIYLDLAKAEQHVRLRGSASGPGVVGNTRLYIGYTLRGKELVSGWGKTEAETVTELASGGLRAWLNTGLEFQVSGWFPILIETLKYAGSSEGLRLEVQEGEGAWKLVPQSQLSPLGCYQDIVRYTSHRQVMGDVAQAFGYQWRIEHQSFESGNFPGGVHFGGLIGRETSIVVNDDDVGTETHVTGAATDVVDGLIVDAAGLADPKGSGQLSAQAVDFSRAAPITPGIGGHMALRQVYDSLAEISDEQLLKTRVDSLLALRGSPNEQVGVRVQGQRDLVDTFPLSGKLARMDWEPGDAVRLRFDKLDMIDATPRQITSVAWPMRPDDLGAPAIGFRSRPRNIKDALRKLKATVYGPRRTYQGSIAIITGGLGAAGTLASAAHDVYSRAPLPNNLTSIVRVVVSVLQVSVLEGFPYGELFVTGVGLGAAGAVVAAGRYDVTSAVKPASYGFPYIYAHMLHANYILTLEVWVSV